MKNIKIILLIGLIVMANGCQDIKQGLTGEKKKYFRWIPCKEKKQTCFATWFWKVT